MATEKTEKFCEEIGKLIKNGGEDKQIVCTVRSLTTASVRYSDGQWKNKPLQADQELIFSGFRPGKRADVLAQFAPADSQEYELIEFPIGKFLAQNQDETPFKESFFALFMAMIGKKKFIDEDDIAGSFGRARTSFMNDVARAEQEEERRQEEERLANLRKQYDDNPTWGLFG